MNEEICCIYNEGKMAKNEWKNDFIFLSALYIVYKKLRKLFFDTLLANLFKQRYINSVTSYKSVHVNKWSIKTFVLVF